MDDALLCWGRCPDAPPRPVNRVLPVFCPCAWRGLRTPFRGFPLGFTGVWWYFWVREVVSYPDVVGPCCESTHSARHRAKSALAAPRFWLAALIVVVVLWWPGVRCFVCFWCVRVAGAVAVSMVLGARPYAVCGRRNGRRCVVPALCRTAHRPPHGPIASAVAPLQPRRCRNRVEEVGAVSANVCTA